MKQCNMVCAGLIEAATDSQMCLQLPMSQYTNTELYHEVSRGPSCRPSHGGNIFCVPCNCIF